MAGDPLAEVRVVPEDGRRNVEDPLSAQLPGQPLGELALAAPGPAEDQRPDAYNAPRIPSTSTSFSSSPRTATRKNPGPNP